MRDLLTRRQEKLDEVVAQDVLVVRPGEKRRRDGQGQTDEEEALDEKPDPRVDRALLGQMHRSHRTATTRRRRLPGCGVRESCNTHGHASPRRRRSSPDARRRPPGARGRRRLRDRRRDPGRRQGASTSSRRRNPDLVLLDVRMPNVDGLACLDEIHRALSRREGRDALGLDLAGADRGRAPPRRERLPREERRPERPARRPCGRRSRATSSARRRSPPRPRTRRAKAPGLTERERVDPGGAREGEIERRDREGALGHPADGEVPPDQHLPQARRQEPDGGDEARLPAGARREPALRRVASTRGLA